MAVRSHKIHGQDDRGITQNPWSGWPWDHTQSMVRMTLGSHKVHGQDDRGITQSPWSG